MNSTWISIEDRMPNDYDDVLVSFVDLDDTTKRYVPSVGYIKNGIWHTKEGDVASSDSSILTFEKVNNVKVTHWKYID